MFTEESAAVFDKIPCWTPLSDAIVATIDYHNSMRHSTGQHPTVKCAKVRFQEPDHASFILLDSL